MHVLSQACIAEAGDVLNLAALDQQDIAKKLLWGHDAPDERAKQILCALALFLHVGFDGTAKAQKDFVRNQLCASLDLAERDFDRLLEPFFGRRILQRAGDYILVTPPPLAVALAAEWWRFANAQELVKLIPQIAQHGMTRSFCNRLQQLHFSPNAQTLAAQLCGDGGPLCDAEVLNTELGSELFRALVELNPAATLECLRRLFTGKSRDELLGIKAGRRHLVWALEKLCWSRQNFVRGATLLLAFGAAENETWANNATAQFKQLFQLYLPGTKTPALDRLPVIEEGLASGCEYRRAICIEALGTALQTDHFSRMCGVEGRGSGLPEEDWAPKTKREISEYWLKCARLLKSVVLEKGPDSPRAKKTLGRHLLALLTPPLLETLEPDFREIALAEQRYWPEAVETIQHALVRPQDQTPESRGILERWLQLLTPQNLSLRLQLSVTDAPFQSRKEANGSFVDVAAEKAEKLADEIVRDNATLTPFLPQLLQGEQKQALAFGARLAEKLPSSGPFIADCLAALRRIEPSRRNPALLAGFFYGLRSAPVVHETLATVASDSSLVDLLVPLTRAAKPNREDLERVLHLVAEGNLPPEHLRQFAYGGVMDHLDASAVTDLFGPLLQRVPGSRAHVLDLLSMYIFQSEERWKACRPTIRSIVVSSGFLSSTDRSMDGYHWQGSVSRLLTETDDEELATEVTRQILEAQRRDDLRFMGDTDQRSVLALLLSKYAAQSWPLVGAELLSKSYYRLRSLLGPRGFNERETSVLWNVPQEILLPWVRQHPSALPRILNIVALFLVDEKGEYRWHPLVRAFLDCELDENAMHAIWSNLGSYGSTGSQVPYIEKRIRLLRQLEEHPKAIVRETARAFIAAFEQDEQRCRKQDEEFSAGIL